MAKRKRMDQIKKILSYYQKSSSIKATSRALGASKNTIRDYLRRVRDSSIDLNDLLELSEDQLGVVFYGSKGHQSSSRNEVFSSSIDEWIDQLGQTGVTRRLLWEEYRLVQIDGYGYSQFCEHLKRHIASKDLTLALEHKAGEVLMLDFAGKKLSWIDTHTGELHYCEVLVGVMPYSQYSFCVALPSQKIEDFVHGINEILLHLGACPKVILSDNLKSYVQKPDRYEPKFTDLCEQLAAHYHLDLAAARVRKPKDKASVENAVRIMYNRVYGPLRNNVFHSINELNKAIQEQLIIHNHKAYQNRSGSRTSRFNKHEQPMMHKLPDSRFEIKRISKAKVQRNYHIFLGADKNYYSVPFKYVGCQAVVLFTRQHVEIYIEGKRITIHQRHLDHSTSHRYQTKTDHMPKHHQEWRQSRGYDEAYFIKQAKQIGENTEWVVQQVLISRIHVSQSYKSCQGIFSLGTSYGNDRLEAACHRCYQCGKGTYGMLKNILKKGLDQIENLDQVGASQLCLGFHQNVRGPKHYS